MLFKLAWRNIWRNKRRSLITAASVTFALFFAIVLRSLQLGTYEHAYAGVINSTTGYLQVHHQGFWEQQSLDKSMALNDSLLNIIRDAHNVKDAVPRLESFSLLSGPSGETRAGLVRGVDAAAEQRYFGLQDKLIGGTFGGRNERTAVLAEGMAESLQLKVGDTVVMIGQGYHGISANAKYPVSGLVKLNNPEMNKRAVYLPLAEAQYLFGAEERTTGVVVIPGDEEELEEIRQSLNGRLDTAVLEVMSWREMMPELVQAIEADSSGGLIILFILYLVISFGLFGTILMLTAERMPEFGILVSIGMSRHRVAFITFLEMLFLGLIGIAGGALLALPISWYFHLHPIHLSGEYNEAMEDYGFEPVIPFSVDSSIWLSHANAVLIITMILSIYALWKIYRLRPVEAMRN